MWPARVWGSPPEKEGWLKTKPFHVVDTMGFRNAINYFP
jgi:hypothetical protein